MTQGSDGGIGLCALPIVLFFVLLFFRMLSNTPPEPENDEKEED
jgi:hypothetical protein